MKIFLNKIYSAICIVKIICVWLTEQHKANLIEDIVVPMSDG